jgi:hypothetical protein
MKDGFLPAVIADKFLSLGAGLFQTLNGTAATAGRLEAAAKALRDEAASDELGESPESGESISRIAELKFRYHAGLFPRDGGRFVAIAAN